MMENRGRVRRAKPSDHDLLRRIARRDRHAVRDLYERYYRRLFAYVFKITRRPEVVEEVLNDVMLAVWRQAGEFSGRSRPSTWIFGIAYRQTLKALRRQRRHTAAEGDGPDPDGLESRDQPGPESLMAQRELASVLGRALATLAPEQRAVVELTFYHGFSYPEIAEIVDCPLGTVKTRMFHARRKLRDALGALGLGEEER